MRGGVLGLPSCALLLGLTACDGGTPALDPDAGVDAGIDAASIAPPLPPVLTACPAGWREVAGARGRVTCDPWPATGYRTDCAWDEAHFVGTPGCTRVGTECAIDGWPTDLPADRSIVYVDDDAAPGGDGSSRTSAFTAIGAAVAAAPSGAIIAVATGLYDEAVSVGAGMTLWGACVSGTRIVTSAPSELEGAVELSADGAGARNLGIDGPERMGILATGADAVSIEAVVVVGARMFGAALIGGSMQAREVVLRGIRARASDGTLGGGIGARADAQLSLSHALIADNRDIGIFVDGAGTNVDASDVVVRGIRERVSDRAGGRGINVQMGAHLMLARALIDDNREYGMFVGAAGARAEASDLVVRATRERASDRTLGRGISVELNGHLVLVRALLEDNREVGIFVGDVGTTAEVSDVVVSGTRERAADGASGRGLDIQSGAHLVLARAVIDDNRDVGIIVHQADASVEASDVVVSGTRERASDGRRGRGIDAEAGARVVLSRTLIDDNREHGIIADGVGTRVDATELTVRDTLPRSSDAALGAGLWVQGGARLGIAGARIERSRWIGIASVDGATAEVRDVVVSGVEASRCIAGTCTGDTGGFGLVAIFGGTFVATRFTVEDATLCGVLVGRDGAAPTALDLENGLIDRSMVGACVQLAGFDTSRLQRAVEYRDVGVPLRATSYELPDSLGL